VIKKLTIFLLCAVFLFFETGLAYAAAKESTNVSGASSRSVSSSYTYYQLKSLNPSDINLYSSRSMPLSYIGTSDALVSNFKIPANAFNVKSKTDTQAEVYMQQYFEKQIPQANYTVYKQELDNKQKEILQTSLNIDYKIYKKMNFEEALRTKARRIAEFDSKPVIVKPNYNIFTGPFSYGSAFAGPWDLWFLLRASDLFWYHHWDEISPFKMYFNEEDFLKRETVIKEMKARNIPVDSSYTELDVDPDLQFSNDYLRKNLFKVYITNKFYKPVNNPFTTLFTILVVTAFLILLIRFIDNRITAKPSKY